MTRTYLCTVSIAASVAAAIAGDRTVTIENRTGGVIRGVYASTVEDDNWHRDRRTENIQAGNRGTIILEGTACRYDFRVLLEQRPNETLLFDVDVCRTPLLVVDAARGRPVVRQAK